MCYYLEYVYECMDRETGPLVRYCDGYNKFCHECELHGKDTEPGEIPCPGKHEEVMVMGSGDVEERAGPCLDCRESVFISEEDIYRELQYIVARWEDDGRWSTQKMQRAMERLHLPVTVGTRSNRWSRMRFALESRKCYNDEAQRQEKGVRFLAKHVKDGDKYISDFVAIVSKTKAAHDDNIRQLERKTLEQFRQSAVRNLRNLDMS
ncbi:hypothetical protein GLAREA_00017 [Glarea lozoyensis ATCC 20868]|uniref:Uncharacterized protein n=1 Tax=Glarea lozoyensis (strain ATCC 20868 / MF5171) TaxID=1116229 RepID=S3CV74_GLAL2|nr:uncharacterized protein GLAREA_00017 [Glarea lozoyensis ATCC 20868]EPE28859.1 hypothetical protein GLAREA_00017 [Glarea lozoyensis ATCC 20868]